MDPNATMYEAAIAYAKSGWFVLPIDKNSKHAGSILGNGWPEKSSRDPLTLARWFKNEDLYGLALHVGRSGAIVFDVDDPSALPYKLRQWIKMETVPYQSTRTNESLRGHYLFATPKGSSYGNSKGYLKGPWGDVRGKNGIIVVFPTPHSKSSEGGQYMWTRNGDLPLLPFDLRKSLPEISHASEMAATTKEIEQFFSEHQSIDLPHLLDLRLSQSHETFKVQSRHDAGRNLVLLCLKDAAANLYDAKTAVEASAQVFELYKPKSEWTPASEFVDFVKWAVGQLKALPADQLALHRETQLVLDSKKFQDWRGGLND